ncbi:MAG: cyclic nucleotide-binding/CBS domain-containing protein [bacterium]
MHSTTLRLPIKRLNPRKPISVQIGQTVLRAIEIMQENRIGCVCVVEDDKLTGIITERDILLRVIGCDCHIDNVKVEEVMTSNPEYLFQDDEIAYAMNRMHVGGFRHVPLTDLQGRPTGIISVKDIVAHLISNLEVNMSKGED